MIQPTNCPIRSYIDLSKVNIFYYAAILSFSIFLGSISSILFISGAVVGLLHIIRHNNIRSVPSSVMMVQYVFALLIIVEAIAAIRSPTATAFNEVFENLPFLGLAGVFYMTRVPRTTLLDAISIISAISAVMAACYVLIRFGLTSRVEIGTGNANVFALASTIVLILNIAALLRSQGYRQMIYLFTSTCAIFLIIMSGSRIMWVSIILIALWSLFFTWQARKALIVSTCSAVILLAGSFLLTQPNNMLNKRISSTITDLDNIAKGDFSGSIGQRVQLYQVGLSIVQARPWLGYGPGNERQIIAHETERLYGKALTFSHAHNAVLTALLRAGIFGLLATMALFTVPLFVLSRGLIGSGDRTAQMGLFIMGSAFIAYLCSGITGLMIGHDLHDSLYITLTSYALYLRFGDNNQVL